MTKQMKNILSLSVVLLLFAGVTVSYAQTTSDPSLRIGYVNPQAVLQKMPKYQAVRQRMQNYVSNKRQEIQKQAQTFQKEVSSFQQRQSVMTKDAKESEQKKLGKLRANLQQAQQQAQQDIQQKRQSLMSPLRTKIQNGIETVAEQMNLSYVISAATVLYVSDSAKQKYNITSKVEQQLNLGD